MQGSIDQRCFIRDISILLIALVSLSLILVASRFTLGAAIVFVSIYAIYAFVVASNGILRKHADTEVGTLLSVEGDSFSQASHENDAIYSSLLRRLTILMVERRWSREYAAASASFAPILLAILWSAQDGVDFSSGKTAYLIGIIVGCILGSLAFWYTRSDQPPRRFLFPWVFGGFFMSIVWFYITATELAALLVGLCVMFEINPSILGLTVLAWGSSLGVLVSNIAFAMHGGDSIQIIPDAMQDQCSTLWADDFIGEKPDTLKMKYDDSNISFASMLFLDINVLK
ncbi:Sodium/calcium exchanger membrane region [Dillenia turbinata]|uniref:Sodium/calcium exchanger membrane region n=1 Tax=Dillenia turbinata TaxID=194707 RepID=A0AAN8YT04_9MAGN